MLVLGLICVVIEVVTSHNLLRPYNFTDISAANITDKTVLENLKRKVYRFRNATETLKQHYIPPSGKRITDRHVLEYLSTKTIAELNKNTSFNSMDMNTSLIEAYDSFAAMSSCLEFLRKNETKFGHGELSKYIKKVQGALYHVRYDIHTILHTRGINGHDRQYDCAKISCRIMELDEAHCWQLDKIMANRLFRSYRDYIIIHQSLTYAERLFS